MSPLCPTVRSCTRRKTTGSAEPGPGLGARYGGAVKLAVNLGYWDTASAENLRLAVEAERLGYSSAWAAEAYGSDAVTVLSWVAAQTSRIEAPPTAME